MADAKTTKAKPKAKAAKAAPKKAPYKKKVYKGNKALSKVPDHIQLLKDQVYMSPFLNRENIACSTMSLGRYNLYNGIGELTLSTSLTSKTWFIYQPSSTGRYMSLSFDNGGGVSTASVNASPLINLQGAGQIPLRFRCSRAGCRAINSSRADSVNGIVKVCSLSQPLNYDFVNNLSASVSATFVSEIESIMTNHVDVIETSAHDYVNSKEFVLSPNSLIDYNKYEKFDSGALAQDIQNQLNSAVDVANPFNVLIMEFSATPSGVQSYSISTRGQFALKFPADDIISHFTVDGALISPETMADIKKHLQGSGMELGVHRRKAYLSPVPT